MKIRHVIVLALMMGAGVLIGRAQGSSSLSPFVLAVTNISTTSVNVAMNTNLVPPFIAVSFDFAFPGVVKVDELKGELAKNGVTNKRPIRIMDGGQILTEGRLIGTVGGSLTNGFILAFVSPAAAKKAAEAMRERGTFFPKPANGQIGDYPPYWGDPSRVPGPMSQF